MKLLLATKPLGFGYGEKAELN